MNTVLSYLKLLRLVFHHFEIVSHVPRHLKRRNELNKVRETLN
jgi:hypothetical protein